MTGMPEEEVLDVISEALALESWFEGKTLTVRLSSKGAELCLAKLRLVNVVGAPSTADLRGEPA